MRMDLLFGAVVMSMLLAQTTLAAPVALNITQDRDGIYLGESLSASVFWEDNRYNITKFTLILDNVSVDQFFVSSSGKIWSNFPVYGNTVGWHSWKIQAANSRNQFGESETVEFYVNDLNYGTCSEKRPADGEWSNCADGHRKRVVYGCEGGNWVSEIEYDGCNNPAASHASILLIGWTVIVVLFTAVGALYIQDKKQRKRLNFFSRGKEF